MTDHTKLDTKQLFNQIAIDNDLVPVDENKLNAFVGISLRLQLQILYSLNSRINSLEKKAFTLMDNL